MTPEDFAFTIVSETLKLSKDNLKEEDKLSTLTKDSIQFFELLVNFETRLGIAIEYEQVADVETIGDIISLLNNTSGVVIDGKVVTKQTEV